MMPPTLHVCNGLVRCQVGESTLARNTGFCCPLSLFIQELSYRKQIARQLCTQFVEGISVILKSTLRVTQGH